MVTVYSKKHCPQCGATYRQLDKYGVGYIVIDVDDEPAAFDALVAEGHRAMPVVKTDLGQTWAGFRPDLIVAYAKARELVAA